MTGPRATLRLQLHEAFTFADAAKIVPYAAELGVSHLYLSPITAARRGSKHGYDVIDPGRVNPELGGEDGLRRLAAVARAAGLGLIVDIVPNHMYVGGNDNPWWLDVLAQGAASRHATFFDIDWEAYGGRILLPVLGEPYGEALAAGHLTVDRNGDPPCLRYHDRIFPLASRFHAGVRAAPATAFDANTEAGRAELHALLEAQHYRLAWWRVAGDEINWRRFFDINELAGLRVEEPDVFEATHAKLLQLYAEGLVDGFRVDHVDGLTDPAEYCRRLRACLAALESARPASAPGPAYLVVEKILGPGETLPADWHTDGTTGYDFMNEVSAVQHDPGGEAPLADLWAAISGRPRDFAVEERRARRELLKRSFAGQLDSAGAALYAIAQSKLATRDISRAAITRVLTELLVHFPVYRTYATKEGRSAADEQLMARTIAAAKRGCLAAERPLLDLIDTWLGGPVPGLDPALRAKAVARFQQLSAPLAAKSVEDTGFYRYGRLLSRNDVGFDVGRFSLSPADFLAASRARGDHFPQAMLATATHDHKRGEDIRARLAVLSELPAEWAAAVRRWMVMNAPLRREIEGGAAPAPGDEAMLYQMMVGAWPPGLDPDDRTACAALAQRLAGWQQKALREAKLRTDWTVPDEDYEGAARDFLNRLFCDPAARAGLAELAAFAERIGPAGAVNGLSQILLKMTLPGVPDFYQGCAFWDLSLVDPDNRRPVDFAIREEALRAGGEPAALARQWPDGRIKQAIIARCLALRRAHPDLFAEGECVPLEVAGEKRDHVVAFARRLGPDFAIIVAPRLVAAMLDGEGIRILNSAWRDTHLVLPDWIKGRRAHDIFGGFVSEHVEARLPLSALLGRVPLALVHSFPS